MTDRSAGPHDDPRVQSEANAPPSRGPQPGVVGSATKLSALAHDLNNILTTVMTYADLLAISFEAGPELDDLREIKKAALTGADLTRKLTMWSRTWACQPRPLKNCRCGTTLERGRTPRSDAEPALTRRVDE